MLDPQSFEDLAPLLQRRGRLRGIVRAQGWAEAEKAKAQRNPAAMREHEQIFGQAPRKGIKSTIKIKSRTSCTRPKNAGTPALPPALALSPLPDLTLHLSRSRSRYVLSGKGQPLSATRESWVAPTFLWPEQMGRKLSRNVENAELTQPETPRARTGEDGMPRVRYPWPEQYGS